jgi:CRISPR-associated endoribonuclease Cas6
MITKYKAYFKSETKLPPYLGAVFQSILLENINLDLASELHSGEHSLRPYHSAVYLVPLHAQNEYVWELIALNETLTESFQAKLSSLFTDHHLKSFDTKIKYLGKYESESTSSNELFKKFYSNDFKENDRVSIKFLTPTSIKTDGRYLHYPREDLILFSLLKKWDGFSDELKLFDMDLYQTISNSLHISSISHLKSQFMNIDKGKVSGFIGQVNFKIKAQTRQINQLINLLLEFANYSGIGIKTAIGMGRVFTSRKLTTNLENT